MIRKPRGSWRHYLACPACQAEPGRPCVNLRSLRSRMRWREEIDQPHRGRVRTSEDQTPKPPPPQMCGAQHPSFQPGSIACSLQAHDVRTWHLHHSRTYGTISWRSG